LRILLKHGAFIGTEGLTDVWFGFLNEGDLPFQLNTERNMIGFFASLQTR